MQRVMVHSLGNQPIAVVGGGDSCMEEAIRFLQSLHQRYTLFIDVTTFKASKIMQERALNNEKIQGSLEQCSCQRHQW